MEQELGQLPPKHAFCLAALPAMHQAHVLSLIPTSIPISNALTQLGAGVYRLAAMLPCCCCWGRTRGGRWCRA